MKKINSSNGMTIIEVLLALVIFSIVSVSIMSLIGNVDKMRIRNRERYHATLIASNAAELLKYYGEYENLNDSSYVVNIKNSEYHVERIRLEEREEYSNLHPIKLSIHKNGRLIKQFVLLQGKSGAKNE